MVRANWKSVIPYAILLVFGFAMVFPFIWMLFSSLKPTSDIISYPPTLLPREITFRHYYESASRLALGILYRNSIFVTVTKTLLTVLLCSISGYIFGKFQFKGKEILFYGLLSTMMVPDQVYITPLYFLMNSFNWINTYQAIIVPDIFSAYGIFLVRQFMHGIPSD